MSEGAVAVRATLTWAGAAIVLATVIPVVEELFLMFAPSGTSWLYSVVSPSLAVASAGLLLIAFVVLAFGLRGEPGIAGHSRVGRSALVVFGALTTLTAGYAALNASMVFTADGPLAAVYMVLRASESVRVAALVVAAVSVLRVRVLMGPARWALHILALALVGTVVLGWMPFPVTSGVWVWELVAVPATLLLTGVLFLVQGLRSPRAIEAPVVSG